MQHRQVKAFIGINGFGRMGILGFEERPLVSVDYVNDARSSIIDAPSTMVVDGTQIKVYAWYDNEWGYVNRMMDIASMVAENL
jgi:glyceraldehyde 3-phosphate dehydrogenase